MYDISRLRVKCHDNPPGAVNRIRWLLDSPCLQYQQGKVKVHCTLEQAMKAKRGSRCIALLFP